MNKYPLWKNLLILFIVVMAGIYSAPNFYPPDPAIQISHESGRVAQSALDSATRVLAEEGIEYFGEVIENGVALVRLYDRDLQSRAQELINFTLSDDYVVALNLAPNTPSWLSSIGAGPMTYGLDLSGGVHFLMEVDMEAALSKQLNDSVATMRTLLREKRIRYQPPVVVDDQNRIVIRFTDPQTRSEANRLIRDEFGDLIFRTAESGGQFLLYLTMSELRMQELQTYALQQNLTTLRTRVNELGVKEPRVQPMGNNRIVIQLPGIQDTARAKELISAVATLQIHLGAEPGAAPGTTEDYEYQGLMQRINTDIIVAGESVTNAQSSFDENGMPQVNITLDAIGARRMNEATRGNIGKPMAIILKETKTRTITEMGPDGELVSRSEPYEEARMISWATIQAALGRQFRITGLQAKEANDLALLIRSGALAAPMYFLEERTVGPSLGQDNIERGTTSVQIGFVLVVVFMLVYYRLCGLLANVALFINLLLLMAVMSIIGATLTMPGIAGIVLTVGMAVDANVLIFSRIREELMSGQGVQKSISGGFDNALSTILDANITTLIVAIVLYSIGTGPVKGFAVTLSIGIITSMITALFITRGLINFTYGGRPTKFMSIGIRMPDPAPARA